MQGFDPKDLEKFQKSLIMRTKISLYGNVGWGLVTLFLMVGLFTKSKDFALIGLVLTSVVFVQTEIISRAFASLHILRNWKALMEPPPQETRTLDTKKDEEDDQ